jgi:hypothetical protein
MSPEAARLRAVRLVNLLETLHLHHHPLTFAV